MNNVNKNVLVLAAGMLVGANVSWGALATPTALPYYAGAEHTTYVATNMIDGNSTSFSVINDDSAGGDPVTGHLVFDMGSAKSIDGMVLTGRSLSVSYNPDNVDFFYYADDDPSNNTLIDDIEGDPDIVSIRTNYNWGGVVNSSSEMVNWADTPAKRYFGMRVNTSRQSSNFQIAEIRIHSSRALAGTPTTPTAIQEFSGAEHATYVAANMIDGDNATFAVISDDDPTPGTGVQGHLVFDMGTTNLMIAGATMTGRDINQNLHAKDVDFFYYADDDPSNNAIADDIEGDADIILITNDIWRQGSNNHTGTIGWETTPTKRYIGMRINSSYATGNFQLAEIKFSMTPKNGTLLLIQ